MSRRRLAAICLAGVLALAATPAAAERLIISLSNHRVMVTSSYTGVDLVLFGSVENEQAAVARRGGYDVVVTVSGPRDTERTRRKGRVFGIWVNVDARTFVNVPSYLAVLSNKPAEAIADADTLRRLQVGFDNFQLPQRIGPDVADVVKEDPFRQAFVRLKQEHGLYVERGSAVTFLTPTLFRADVPMPPNVPFGIYEVDVKLFADGAMVAQSTSALEVIKVGFEQFVAVAARDYSLLYGLATAMLALLTGWFASVVFRKD
ncbi:MAG TPA: TIGR02186 family protein [Xanthobacteraceae bacterium]|nr:TIGR02186 family protein [Xanthobacteraceae bacterium]